MWHIIETENRQIAPIDWFGSQSEQTSRENQSGEASNRSAKFWKTLLLRIEKWKERWQAKEVQIQAHLVHREGNQRGIELEVAPIVTSEAPTTMAPAPTLPVSVCCQRKWDNGVGLHRDGIFARQDFNLIHLFPSYVILSLVSFWLSQARKSCY